MRPCLLVACLLAAGCSNTPTTSPQTQAAKPAPVATPPMRAIAPEHPDDPVIARFAGKLASSDAFERMHGAMGLAIFGEQAKSAAPALCKALLKVDDDERPVVANALSTMSPDLHGPVTVMAEGKDTLAINKAEQHLLKLGPKARDAWPWHQAGGDAVVRCTRRGVMQLVLLLTQKQSTLLQPSDPRRGPANASRRPSRLS